MRKIVLLIIFAFFIINQAYSSPVNLPNGIKGKEGLFLKEKIAGVVDVSGSFLYDNFSRKLKDTGKVNAEVIGGQVGLTFVDRFDLYALFGQIQNAEYQETILGSDVKFEFENTSMWGIGLNAVIYEWEKAGIQLFGDGNYRQAKDIGYEAIVIDGTRYTKNQLSGLETKAKWEEWQVALGISKKFKYFVPYAGVKYSDVKTSAKATYSGTTYDLGSAKSKGTVGPFIGVSILPVKGVSIDLGGRFVDEQAFSVKATVRF